MAFPTTLDSFSDKTDAVDYPQANDINVLNSALELVEAKVGVDSSAVATSIDYLIKNTSSGHAHDGSGSKKVAAANINGFLDEDDMASNSNTSIASQQSIKAYITSVMSTLNPIGTIREFNVSTNPATLLGFGTWSAYGSGRVTVAISADTEFDTVDEEYGSKTHALSIAELAAHNHGGATGNDSPDHTHAQSWASSNNSGTGGGGPDNGSQATGGASVRHTHTVASQGSGTAHNNIQPSITVYRWVRTA